MKDTFEYNFVTASAGTIEIEDIGNVALDAWNQKGVHWYMIIRTLLGTTSIATIGPVTPGVKLLPTGFTQKLLHCDYEEYFINKQIDKFLNQSKAGITDVKEVAIEDAIEQVRNFQEYLENYSEDQY